MNKKNNPYKKGLRNLTFEEQRSLDNLVEQIPKSEWPRIWNELNLYHWPKELGELPVSFDEGRFECPELLHIMKAIETACGYKAVFRYEHLTQLGETNEQFEDWWDSKCLEETKEMQRKLDKRDYKCYGCNDERNNGFSISEFLLGLSLGHAVAFFLVILVGICT